MYRHQNTQKLLYRIERSMGRHLFLLGTVLLAVIIAGLATPAIVIIYAMRASQPWWMATGATLFTLAGVAAVLHAVPRILGPRGVTGIVEARNRSATLPLLDIP
jgi:hypothetical protein